MLSETVALASVLLIELKVFKLVSDCYAMLTWPYFLKVVLVLSCESRWEHVWLFFTNTHVLYFCCLSSWIFVLELSPTSPVVLKHKLGKNQVGKIGSFIGQCWHKYFKPGNLMAYVWNSAVCLFTLGCDFDSSSTIESVHITMIFFFNWATV